MQSLKIAIEAATAFDVTKYGALVETRQEVTRRRDEAGSKAFDGLKISGLFTAEWRIFIQAAEDYLSKHASEGYPQATDTCVYCQQPLTVKALELIKKYPDFTNNDIKAALDKAVTELREYIAPITALKADALQQQYSAETSDGDDILSPVAPVVEHLSILAINVASSSAITWPEKSPALVAAEKLSPKSRPD